MLRIFAPTRTWKIAVCLASFWYSKGFESRCWNTSRQMGNNANPAAYAYEDSEFFPGSRLPNSRWWLVDTNIFPPVLLIWAHNKSYLYDNPTPDTVETQVFWICRVMEWCLASCSWIQARECEFRILITMFRGSHRIFADSFMFRLSFLQVPVGKPIASIIFRNCPDVSRGSGACLH